MPGPSVWGFDMRATTSSWERVDVEYAKKKKNEGVEKKEEEEEEKNEDEEEKCDFSLHLDWTILTTTFCEDMIKHFSYHVYNMLLVAFINKFSGK